MIKAVSAAFKIRTLMVWQLVPNFAYDLQHHPYYQADKTILDVYKFTSFGYEVMEERRKHKAEDDEFLSLARIQEGRSDLLYCDGVHYTISFMDEIARRIAEHIVSKHLLS